MYLPPLITYKYIFSFEDIIFLENFQEWFYKNYVPNKKPYFEFIQDPFFYTKGKDPIPFVINKICLN